MARPVVDLPQPDSPTRPSVSPRRTSKLRPSTARTAPTLRCTITPEVMGKWTLRPSILTSVSPPSAAVGARDAAIGVGAPTLTGSGHRRRDELV